MSYRIALEPTAIEDLSKLPRLVREYVAAQLCNLADSPSALSHRSHFPFLPKCRLCQFDYDFSGQRYFITVLFQFSQDETTLHILGISCQIADDWWSK